MVLKFECENKFVSRKYPQVLAAFAATIGAISIGNVIAWTSPVLPLLKDSEKFSTLTDVEISWTASLVSLGAVLGGPVAGYSISRYGRKLAILLLCFPFAIGWLLIIIAENVEMMCAGRFLTGLCCGAYCLALPIYLSEISEESIRGILGSVFPTFCSFGVISTYTLGTFVSWETLTIASAIVPVVNLICVSFAPESPIFLISKGRRKAAGESLMKLRGSETFEQIEPELSLIEGSFLESNLDTKLSVKVYFKTEVLKPLAISLVLMILQQFSGINAVLFYTVNIFRSTGSNIDPNLASIIVSFILLVGMLISTVLIEKAGRRALFITSEIAMTICLLGLAIFFYIKSGNDGVAPDYLTWLPLGSLMAYAIAFNLGAGPLPWLMMAEILPSHVKGATSALATSFNWMLSFIVIKFFLQISLAFGMSTCYFIFATCCAFGVIFVYFFVPETKGKTLDEIQKSFL